VSLSSYALARPRFTVLGVVFLVLAGLWLALDFPSTEEPPVTVRAATIISFVPGASVNRVEQLVVRPTEEAVRSIADVKKVKSTVRPGFAFTYVELRPTVSAQQLPTVWQRLRARMDDLRPQLPEGTLGPLVDDEFGRVAVMTVGLTGSGYTHGELRHHARAMRDALQQLQGVERVTLHGIRDEQVQVVLDVAALAAKGVRATAVAEALARRNIVAPAGFVELGGAYLPLTVTGDVSDPQQLAATPIPLPAGGSVPLGLIAKVERVEQDPPLGGAFVDGAPAAVIAVSMSPGLNVVSFAERLRERMQTLEAGLPVGMKLMPITDQAQIVTRQLRQVGQVFLETTVIVMGIVVLFLGLRTGLIVGAIVPTTIMGTLAVMKLLGIELHIWVLPGSRR
jgi:multidrug efflux pump subunit AcrB